MRQAMMTFCNGSNTGRTMQAVRTSLQADNHANTSSLNFFTGLMLFLMPKQRRQSIKASYSTM